MRKNNFNFPPSTEFFQLLKGRARCILDFHGGGGYCEFPLIGSRGNVQSKKINTAFLLLGFPISSSIVFFHYKRTNSLKKFLFYLLIEFIANKDLVLVPKKTFLLYQ